MEKKYWQNFEDYNQDESEPKPLKNEFHKELPLEELADETIFNGKTARRDFLKYLGFSTAAATIAASCETPVRRSIPYLHKPDDVLPGVANYYASTYIDQGDAVPVVVKQREGRPIKIEGNELSSLTDGGTSAQCQSSVLDLYDSSRLRYPLAQKKEATFEAIDKMVGDALSAVAGKPFVLLTSSMTSPSAKQIIGEFLTKYPGSRHVQYDAVSYSGLIMANEASYGKRAIPAYHFENAKIIVSLGADFLGTWLSPVVFAKQYAATRRINESRPEMSRHIQFESHFSLTGANADDRYVHKPSETGAIALALLGALGGGTSATVSGPAGEGVKKVAAELSANKGAALVVCGSNDPNVQIIVNAINNIIEANGKTIDWASTVNYRQGLDAEMATLTNDLNAGSIGALFVYQANPVYSFVAADKFAEGLKKCPLTVSFTGKMDETTELCKYVIPSHHWLESWGDSEPQTGHFSVLQPLIHPLFKTRQFEDSLLKLIGNPTPFIDYFRNLWVSKLGSVNGFDAFLQDGIIEKNISASSVISEAKDTTNTSNRYQQAEPATALSGASFIGNVADASQKISAKKGGETELVLYEKVSIGNGSHGNNAWLHELSDPISRATWDNYAMISPQMGESLFGINIYDRRQSDAYEVNVDKPVMKVTANGKTIEIPVLIIPGTHPNVIAIALGYGRQSSQKEKTGEYIGRAAENVGINVYPLTTFDGTSISYASAVTVEKTSKQFPIARTQLHNITEGRPIVRETTLKDFKTNPGKLNEEEREELERYGEHFVPDATMYPTYEYPGLKWGMSIDLNTCIGCSACTIACVAENNIAIVGKKDVARMQDMQWLRIDRYFTGNPENPSVVFQPMLCQQCDNAPCENVCPVAATTHSSEGLNQMIYNRCIGTKYCANNCPYKVRRFNWADFRGADAFPDNQRGIISNATADLDDELTRLVINPDVTVRSRGVMEKCTFCIQRIQEGKLHAKIENRPLKDLEVKTACMQACPTQAIMFGNVNDKTTRISELRLREQKERKYYVLEELHVLSNVNYLVKVRNTDHEVGDIKEEHHS